MSQHKLMLASCTKKINFDRQTGPLYQATNMTLTQDIMNKTVKFITVSEKSHQSTQEKYHFPKKGRLFRIGAAHVIKGLIESRTVSNNTEALITLNKVCQSPRKKNVARRGKPLRRNVARITRLIDYNTPNESPESITELVSERNFCRLLLNDDASSTVKTFAEERLSYINYKLNKFI